MTMQTSVPITHPKQWYSGTGTQILSRSVVFIPSEQTTALFTRFRCVSKTPLGDPVVPDVY